MGFLRRILGGGGAPPSVSPAETGGQDVGIFAGLFVADSDDVEAWDLDELTPAAWPATEFKRLETVKLGTLEAILTGVAYDDIDQDDLHSIVRHGGEEGPWLARVRGPLVDALASLPSEGLGAAAEAWANTDEFKLNPNEQASRRDIEDLADRLREMTDLARLSRETGKPMYLLMSL